MRADGVGDVLDGDGVEVLVVAGGLNEELLVKVVEVVAHKHVDVTHYLQHVHALPGKPEPRMLAVLGLVNCGYMTFPR